jgi:hypothetical protein
VVDALEDQASGEPTEDDIVEMLKKFGPPRAVAASYYPKGQYLIGPALFPLFRLVVGITLAAVFGAQLLAWVVAFIIAQEPFHALEAIGGLLSSIPAAFGMVVIVFAILQWFDVRPVLEDEPWDPVTLPQISEAESVKRGERIFGIVVSIVILVILFFFPDKVGFVTTPGGEFFANPVIVQYMGWISVSLLLSIGLDIYLLWQGRWKITTRLAKIAVNVFSNVILFLLVQGHSAWLAERGASGLFATLEQLPDGGFQVLGMHAFRLAFGVALIVTVIETITMLYRLVKVNLVHDLATEALTIKKA